MEGAPAVPLYTTCMMTKLNFTIFELFSVVHLFDVFRELLCLGNECEQWITESLDLIYQSVLGIRFGHLDEPNF